MVARRPLRYLVAALAVSLAVLPACSAKVAGSAAPAASVATPDSTGPTSEDAGSEEETPLPPGASPGYDDINEDGEPDPICSEQDYGGGLVVLIPCNYADYASAPTDDTQLVPNSLFGLPGLDIDLTGISGSAVQARNKDGQKLVILFINSDTLFETGSANLADPARENFDAISRLIQNNWASGPIQVRGHTDSTGGAAANQALSERRAAAAVDYLSGQGIDRSRLSAVGLGPSVPIVLETNPDGSVNETGRQYNRRVELVIIVP